MLKKKIKHSEIAEMVTAYHAKLASDAAAYREDVSSPLCEAPCQSPPYLAVELPFTLDQVDIQKSLSHLHPGAWHMLRIQNG